MNNSRVFARMVIAAMLASCGAGERDASSRSASSDTTINDSPSEVTQPPQADSLQPGPLLITPDGWGPLRIGMTTAEVVAAAGEDANPEAVGGPVPGECDEFRPRNAPDGVLVMIENGVLTRISISRNSDIKTSEGLGVGDTGARVIEAYGSRARVDPHKYWEPPAKYITVWRETATGQDRRGIRYEVDPSGNVVHLRAGSPSIEYVEGCL